jgi:predicted nucleotidyltransferase
MKTDPRIEHKVFLEIQRYLSQIEAKHNVVIIQAIESGSRAWGFPSPESDAYYHYRSMAKKAYTDIESSEAKKLKRFFYFARATLSAKWITVKATMPSILFSELVAELVLDKSVALSVESLVAQKASESEASTLQVPPDVYRVFTEMYDSLEESQQFNAKESRFISNKDFASFLSNISNQ